MKAFGHSLRPLNSCKHTIAAAVSVLIWTFFVGMLGNLPGGTDAVTAGEALIAIAQGTLCAALDEQYRQQRELVVLRYGLRRPAGAVPRNALPLRRRPGRLIVQFS